MCHLLPNRKVAVILWHVSAQFWKLARAGFVPAVCMVPRAELCKLVMLHAKGVDCSTYFL